MAHLINITDLIEKRLMRESKLQYISKEEAAKINTFIGKAMVIAKRKAVRNQRISRNASSIITLNS